MQINWQQVRQLTAANLKARYRNTFWGFAWVVLNPTLQFFAQALAFHYILKIDVVNYPLFLLSGTLPWIYWTQCIEMGTGTLVTNGKLLKSFPIHPFTLLASMCIENLVGFLATLVLLISIVGGFTNMNLLNLLVLPLAVIPLVASAIGLSFALSMINARFRDTRFVVSFCLTLLFFATPIFYPIEIVPPNLRWISSLNPFYHLLKPFRFMIDDPFKPEFLFTLGSAAIVSLACVAFGVVLWKFKKNSLYLEV
jgi:ABC-type polysaccharide/polyol phosphate export permease